MANRLTTVLLDCADPERLAAFWGDVLGYEVRGRDAGEGWVEIGPPGLAAPDGPVPTLLFQRVPDPTPGKNRLHLDLNATDRDQAAELERLLSLGATHADIGQGPFGENGITWHVLADPEGNEFCLLRSRVEPLRAAQRQDQVS